MKTSKQKKNPADGQSSLLKFAYLIVTMTDKSRVVLNLSFKHHACIGFREVAFPFFAVILEAKIP